MSIQARQQLVNHAHTVFRCDSQRSDFLDPNKTRTELIALLLELINKGHIILFTAVNSDHRDDGCGHSHHNGDASDVWLLVTPRDGDYCDAGSSQMIQFVKDIMASPWTYQLGLAGSARIFELIHAAGFQDFPTDTNRLFDDDREDHLHIGAQFK